MNKGASIAKWEQNGHEISKIKEFKYLGYTKKQTLQNLQVHRVGKQNKKFKDAYTFKLRI